MILQPNEIVTVTLMYEGGIKLEYQAQVLGDDGSHVVVEATYAEPTRRDLGYVRLDMADVWTEHYWRDRWFSVKEIRSEEGKLKGWYCDVARPASIGAGSIVSEDLFLDLWMSRDRATVLRLDEDEFARSGLGRRDPIAAANAERALDELESHARDGWRILVMPWGS